MPLSPEIKELCEIAVTLRHTEPWIPKEVDKWKKFRPQSLNVARAALALDAENQRLRKALAEPLVLDVELPHGIREKFEAALGSLPLAGDAPSVATQPNESQPVP